MSHRNGSPRRRSCIRTTDRLSRHSESGAALIIALVFVIVFGVILAALLTYAGTSVSTDRAYRKVRNQRYDATNAIDLAINTVRNQARMGRDPKLSSLDPKCRFENAPQVNTGEIVTVSCAAKAGGGSGKPAQGGLVPDDAIVALGTRHNESPPFNQADCGIAGLGNDAASERSILFKTSQVRQGTDLGGIFCNNRSRPSTTFSVRGNVKAAGKVEVSNGNVTLVAKAPGQPSTISTPAGSAGGCSGAISPACITGSATDPGNGGTGAWENVPVNWSGNDAGGRPYVRTTAYTWDGTTLVPAASCASQGTLIFLPGWYKDATILNQYTANGSCKEATFWFAPETGPDGVPATDDDVTGAYYFGFRNGNATACSSAASQAHRWCIGGGAADSSPRVVVGTAKGWNPLSTGGGGGPTTRTIQVIQADTVDSGLSQSWFNGGGAKKIGDGSVAEYRATAPPLLCPSIVCISSDRSIRVRDLQPKVAAAPDRVSGNAGPITVEIAHRETASSPSLNNPRIEFRAVGDESGIQSTCSGSFYVPLNTGALTTAKVRLGTAGTVASQEEAAANAIGACFPSADLINGLQITMKVGGNTSNAGSPKVYLDGVQMSFSSTPRATFPLPATVGTADANIDCDPEGPGAQLIFGGDSHVYVADGSLEVCAGAFPTDIEEHQQIGIWQKPAVAPIRPTSASAAPSVVGPGVSVSNAAGATRIGEPAGISSASISRSASCNASGVTCLLGTGGGTQEAGINLSFPAYTPPAGTAIESVSVRAAYDSNGVVTSPQFSVDGCEGRSTFQPSAIRVLLYADLVSDSRNNLSNCIAGKLSTGFTGTWYARSIVACLFGGCLGSINGDRLDGVELVVTLRPIDNNTEVIVPASGCTQSYPNYWAGTGSPDCAVLKADSIQTTPIISGLFPQEANWFGRFTVQGTIYAPSGAVEIDDSDAAYPSASRGMVVRHLRVTGYKTRSGYSGPAVDTVISKNTNPREMVFTACIQSAARRAAAEKCSATDDQVLSRAKVRYEIDPATTSGATQPLANVPRVLWWSVDR